jgi:hypothetical protein
MKALANSFPQGFKFQGKRGSGLNVPRVFGSYILFPELFQLIFSAGGLDRNHRGQRFDKMLPETVSIGSLGGNQQNVAGLDIIAKVHVPPDVMRGA